VFAAFVFLYFCFWLICWRLMTFLLVEKICCNGEWVSICYGLGFVEFVW
jgi:hypothetical protein